MPVTQTRKGISARGPAGNVGNKGLQTTISTMQPNESFRGKALLVNGS